MRYSQCLLYILTPLAVMSIKPPDMPQPFNESDPFGLDPPRRLASERIVNFGGCDPSLRKKQTVIKTDPGP